MNVIDEIKENKEEIIEFLQQAQQPVEYTSIDPTEKKEYYTLSSAQKRIYMIQQWDPASTAYNMSSVKMLEGEIDREKMEESIRKLTRRHEILRTSFRVIEREPFQYIYNDVDFSIEYTVINDPVDMNIPQSLVMDETIAAFIRPFDLSQPPLLRVNLVKIAEQKHLLVFEMHHIIADGSSLKIFIKDFMAYYTGEDLPPLRIQYKGFCHWQLRLLNEGKLKHQEEYWHRQLQGDLPILSMPTDYPRPGLMNFAGQRLRFRLDNHLTRGLHAYIRKTGTTLYTLLLSLYCILLYKYTGQEDIMVGSPAADRRHPGLAPMIGLFMETLVLRNTINDEGNQSFTEFLHQVQTNTLKAFDNQDYPFRELVKTFAEQRDLSRNPLFSTMLIVQDMDMTELEIAGLKLTPYESDSKKVSKVDITLEAMGFQAGLIFVLEYCTKLFKQETIERLWGHFVNIMAEVLQNPGIKLSEINMLREEEKQQIMEGFNCTTAEYVRDKPVHELFAEQVQRTPDNISVVGNAQSAERKAPSIDRNKERQAPCSMRCAITYRELNEKSNQLAHLLKKKGVRADTIVGIMAERSVEMIVGILGILKAGGAYLPIDPDYPEDRIDFVLNDSNAKFLLKDNIFTPEVLNNRPKGTSIHLSSLLPFYPSNPSNLAYIIYTSGTTGRPKGVMIEHGALVNICFWNNRFYRVTGRDHASQYASSGFDASVLEIFPYLIKGAALYIINEELKLDLDELGEYFERHDITIGFLPTLLCEQFMQHENHSLRILLTGGDKLRVFQEKKYKLYNNYGPTENTVIATSHPVDCYCANIPIGKPIDNNCIYILNPGNFQLQPVGVPGELCISGTGVARGYLNRPELTAKKFCLRRPGGRRMAHGALRSALCALRASPHKNFSLVFKGTGKNYIPPFPHSPFYQTGDLARWLSYGNIEFLGRVDNQVKVRGYRVELGEIENQLLKQDTVKEAVVVVREDVTGDKYITAYLVTAQTGETKPWEEAVAELRTNLSQQLPNYMIPTYFVQMDHIPLTSHGKTELAALPTPGFETGAEAVKHITPGDPVEEKLVEIWSEVLGIKKEHIGIDYNFFEIGGHSLRATIVMTKIHKAFNTKIPLAVFFKTPSIKALAGYIREAEKETFTSIQSIEEKEYYPLSSAQKRMFILNRLKGDDISDNGSGVLLIEGELDRQRFERTIHALVKRHEAFRTSFEILDGHPVQRVHRQVDFKIKYIEAGTDSNIEEIEEIIDGFIVPFDLGKPSMLRVGLVKLAENKHLLLFDIHHIISDGVSMNILRREFMDIYYDEELPPLPIQYKDFTQWQNNRMQAAAVKKQDAYWLDVFAEKVPDLDMPTDFPRPAVQSFAGDYIAFEWDEELSGKIDEICQEYSASLFMVLLTIYNILLYKYTGQEDIVVGTPIAGRPHVSLENVIGFFVNTLALRNYPRGEKTFAQFLTEVKANALNAYENQDYQFEELVEKLGLQRDSSRSVLFDIMFAVQNTEVYLFRERYIFKSNIKDLVFKPFKYKEKITQFDIIIHAFEIDDCISFKLRYCTKLFKKETIEKLNEYFEAIAASVLDNPLIKLKDIKVSLGLLDKKPNIPEISLDF